MCASSYVSCAVLHLAFYIINTISTHTICGTTYICTKLSSYIRMYICTVITHPLCIHQKKPIKHESNEISDYK